MNEFEKRMDKLRKRELKDLASNSAYLTYYDLEKCLDEMRSDFPYDELKLSMVSVSTLIKLRDFYKKWLLKSDEK